MERISNDDHGAQRSFLGLLYGPRQHAAYKRNNHSCIQPDL